MKSLVIRAPEQRLWQSRSFSTHLVCKLVWSLFYHKKLWRSIWAPTAPKSGVFGTNRVRAKCRCWIVFSFYRLYATWNFWRCFLFGFGFFWDSKIWRNSYTERKVTSLAKRDTKCQALTSVSLSHHNTQWNSLLKKRRKKKRQHTFPKPLSWKPEIS